MKNINIDLVFYLPDKVYLCWRQQCSGLEGRAEPGCWYEHLFTLVVNIELYWQVWNSSDVIFSSRRAKYSDETEVQSWCLLELLGQRSSQPLSSRTPISQSQISTQQSTLRLGRVHQCFSVFVLREREKMKVREHKTRKQILMFCRCFSPLASQSVAKSVL